MQHHVQQVKELEIRLANMQKERDEAIKKEILKLEHTQQLLLEYKKKCTELDRKVTVAYKEVW